MLTVVGLLLVVVLVLFGAYSGAREGAFYGTYVLLRTLIGLLMALTFSVPLAVLANNMFGTEYPWYDYLLLTCFCLLFAGTTTALRQFKVRATSPSIPCVGLFDTLYGAAAGFCNGVLLSGVVLIVISLVPALPFMSASVSRFEMAGKPIDTGERALRFYSFVEARFGGNWDFPLDQGEPLLDEDGDVLQSREDVNMNDKYDFPRLENYHDINENGQWDPSWLGRYRDCWKFGTVEASRVGYPLAPAEAEEDEDF